MNWVNMAIGGGIGFLLGLAVGIRFTHVFWSEQRRDARTVMERDVDRMARFRRELHRLQDELGIPHQEPPA